MSTNSGRDPQDVGGVGRLNISQAVEQKRLDVSLPFGNIDDKKYRKGVEKATAHIPRGIPKRTSEQELITLRGELDSLQSKQRHHQGRIAESEEIIQRLQEKLNAAIAVRDGLPESKDLLAEAETKIEKATSMIETETKFLKMNQRILADVEAKLKAFPREKFDALSKAEKLVLEMRSGMQI